MRPGGRDRATARLWSNPTLLVLDEPFVSPDAALAARLRAELKPSCSPIASSCCLLRRRAYSLRCEQYGATCKRAWSRTERPTTFDTRTVHQAIRHSNKFDVTRSTTSRARPASTALVEYNAVPAT
jgi:hypothetical protein